jgi:hypothetical protein
MNAITYEDISNAEADLEQKRRAYLRHWGWTYTSTTPDHSWMWRRTFDGVTYMADTGEAIRMTLHALDNE